jgi:hypothetical protein
MAELVEVVPIDRVLRYLQMGDYRCCAVVGFPPGMMH